MSFKTKKKFFAFLSGASCSCLADALWCLPDIRIHEGLDWRIEVGIYLMLLGMTGFYGWLAFRED